MLWLGLILYFVLNIKIIQLVGIILAVYLFTLIMSSIILEFYQLKQFKANNIPIECFNVTSNLSEQLVLDKNIEDVRVFLKSVIPPLFQKAYIDFSSTKDSYQIITKRKLSSWGEIIDISIHEIGEAKTRIVFSSKPKYSALLIDSGNSAINIFKMKKALLSR